MERHGDTWRKRVEDLKAPSSADAGLAAAFGGTTSEQDQERESPDERGAFSFLILFARR